MTTLRRKSRKPMIRSAPGKRWVRLSPAARLELILSEAIIFFAEHGFEAQTRGLAARIGVSQALIYRYFRTKADLIDKVYQRIYLSHWNAFWEKILSDRRISLERRLKEFAIFPLLTTTPGSECRCIPACAAIILLTAT